MPVVETERHGQILVVRMNRPERLNALNHELRTSSGGDLDRVPPQQRTGGGDLHRHRPRVLRRRGHEGVAGERRAGRAAPRDRRSVHVGRAGEAGDRRGQRLRHGRRLHAGRAHRPARRGARRGVRGVGGEALAARRLQPWPHRQRAVSDRDGDGARLPLHRRALLRRGLPQPPGRCRRADADCADHGGASADAAAGLARQHGAHDAADAPVTERGAAAPRGRAARARRQERPDGVSRGVRREARSRGSRAGTIRRTAFGCRRWRSAERAVSGLRRPPRSRRGP